MKLLTAYFAISFYILGGLLIENDVNYPTWYHLNAVHFGAYHLALENRLRIFLFTPILIENSGEVMADASRIRSHRATNIFVSVRAPSIT